MILAEAGLIGKPRSYYDMKERVLLIQASWKIMNFFLSVRIDTLPKPFSGSVGDLLLEVKYPSLCKPECLYLHFVS